ncbi:MAG: signal peptidase II [Bacteroidota bacterium]
MKNTVQRLVWMLGSAAVVVGIDQWVKVWAKEHVQGQPMQAFLNDMFFLIYAENSGVAFSLGSGLDPTVRFWLFEVLVALFLIGLTVFVVRQPLVWKSELVAYGLILGGGFGNWLDRLLNNGAVIDYALIQVGPLRTAIFNLADSCILVGFFVLIAYSFVHARHEKAAKREAEATAEQASGVDTPADPPQEDKPENHVA